MDVTLLSPPFHAALALLSACALAPWLASQVVKVEQREWKIYGAELIDRGAYRESWAAALICLGLGLVVLGRHESAVGALAAAAFLGMLCVLAIVDMRTLLLPDRATQLVLWSGLAWNASFFGWTTPGDALLGAGLGYGSVWLVNKTTQRAAKNGAAIGLGDAKLLAGIGAWTGLSGLATAIVVASITLLPITFACRQAIRRSRQDPSSAPHRVPLGPSLALGGAIACLQLVAF